MIRITLARPCLLLLIASATCLCAQEQTRKDNEAVVVLQQSLTAMRGAASGTTDSIATGTITFHNGGAPYFSPITLKTKDETAHSTELTLNGKQSVSVVNRGLGSKRQDGKTGELPLWTTKYALPEHLLGLRLKQALDGKSNVVYLGLEDVSGQSCHRIQIFASPPPEIPAEQEKMISEFELFIDSKTFLLVKTKSYIFSPEIIENRSLLETYYSDYRDVNGMLVPFRISRHLSGSPYSETVLESVDLNATLSSSDFE